jgi:hypothetical protein
MKVGRLRGEKGLRERGRREYEKLEGDRSGPTSRKDVTHGAFHGQVGILN